MAKHTVKDFLGALFDEGLVKSFVLSAELMERYVEDLSFSTKTLRGGGIFVCKGLEFKSEYVYKAAELGALLYVSEQAYAANLPAIIVNDVRRAMPVLAMVFYDAPLLSMSSVGVTGTKGKTTTSFMIKSVIDDYMAEQNRSECALVSSVYVCDGRENHPSLMTTPEAIELQGIFARARDNGCEYIVSEISSQALKYHRCTGARFKVAVFTNISPDHISPLEHEDFEDYFSSKLEIFKMCENALIFSGADRFEEIYSFAKKHCEGVYTFGRRKNDSFCIETCCEGTMLLNGEKYSVSLPGDFNMVNAAGAVAVCKLLGIKESFIKSGIEKASVPGRCERFSSDDNEINAIVDYAHNKESMTALVSLARKYYPDKKICLVFGCPGKKAYNRREELGRIASFCDYAVVTEDDPATEEVADICEGIMKYACGGDAVCRVIEDRPEAIAFALREFGRESVVLVAGKGSERFQKRKSGPEEYKTDSYYVKKYINEYNKEKATLVTV